MRGDDRRALRQPDERRAVEVIESGRGRGGSGRSAAARRSKGPARPDGSDRRWRRPGRCRRGWRGPGSVQDRHPADPQQHRSVPDPRGREAMIRPAREVRLQAGRHRREQPPARMAQPRPYPRPRRSASRSIAGRGTHPSRECFPVARFAQCNAFRFITSSVVPACRTSQYAARLPPVHDERPSGNVSRTPLAHQRQTGVTPRSCHKRSAVLSSNSISRLIFLYVGGIIGGRSLQ